MSRSLKRTLLSLLSLAAPVALVAAVLAAPSASADAPAPPSPVSCAGCWHPAVNTSWNWVLSSVPKAPFRNVQMYDIDGFNAAAGDVTSLHGNGIKAVCYISAGTYENWRSDASQFPASLLGAGLPEWPGENWLDIRDVQNSNSVLRQIMDARLDMCQTKGFDMVEFDNVDGYTNNTGFPLTAADQVYFNAVLANDSHARGMSVLLKNDKLQIPDLLPYFDGTLDEQCNETNSCSALSAFVNAGKPVFQAEYTVPTSTFCAPDNAADFNGVHFALHLDDSVFEPCR